MNNIINAYGWPETKLSDIGLFSKGSGITKDQLVPVGHNAVRYGELYTKFNFKIEKIYSHIPDSVVPTATKIKFGDILFAGSGETIDEIGKSAVYMRKDDCCAGGDIIIFTPRNANSLFLSYFLNIGEGRKKLRELGQGQSVVHIYKSEIEKLKLHLPPLSEQNRIVSVLETWDKSIEKIAKKLKIKKKIKKGLMQKLLIGDFRLASFNAPWDVSALHELGKTYSGIVGKDKDDFGFGEPYISYMDIYSNWKIEKISGNLVNIQPNEKQNDVKYGDILFTTSSETPNEVGISSVLLKKNIKKVFLNSFCFGFRLNNFNILIPEYAQYYFRGQKFRKEMLRLAQGASRFNLSKKYFLVTKINIPSSVQEQSAIANILTTADQEIELLQRKLKKLKEQKKYLLNNLITGAIRTPENLS